MRKWVLLVSVVVVVLLATVLSLATKTDEPCALDNIGNMAAHRGGAALYPENTLTAFKAIKKDMPDVVLEMDVVALADGTLVINHDKTVDRTTNGTGRVADMSLAQWEALRVNGPNSTAPTSTLDDVLDEYAGTDVPMFIELKDYTVSDKFIETLFPHRGQVVVAAFNAGVAERFVKSGFQTMQLSTKPPTLIPGVQYVGVSNKNITTTFVNTAHDAGTKVWAWGDDVTGTMPTTDTRNIDGYIANDPRGPS